MPDDVGEIITELAQLGYTITYLGRGLGEYNQRLMITGELYQAEISCLSDGEYKLRYKIYPTNTKNTVSRGHVLDVYSLDDLREVVEPNIKTLVEWVVNSEPFVYILDESTNTVRNIT